MKKLFVSTIGLALLLTAGCKNTSPAVYSIATATAVSYGLRNSPETANRLREIQPLTCAMASGTNLTPAEIVSAIEASGIAGGSPESQLIINGVMVLYIAAYDSLGSATNASSVSPYARAVFCEGFQMGLAGAPVERDGPLAEDGTPVVRSRNAPPARTWWPLLKD